LSELYLISHADASATLQRMLRHNNNAISCYINAALIFVGLLLWLLLQVLLQI